MLFCFIWLLIATLAIQIPNILGIQSSANGSLITFTTALKISILTLPATLIASTGFTLFYARGIEFFSYPAMALYAKVFALVAAIVIQVVLLKSRGTNSIELIGLLVCLSGILISIFSKEISDKL